MVYPLNIREIFSGNSKNEMIFVFNGVITQDLIVLLAETIREELSLYCKPQLVNRVFAIFIEMAQNVMHHSDEKFYFDQQSFGKGQLILLKNHDGFEIITINRVNNSQKKFLMERNNLINKLNRQELKELYIKTRRQKNIVNTKGAGLGFIDIARRSGIPLSVDFENIDDYHHEFSLRVKVNKSKKKIFYENIRYKMH